MLLMDPLDFLLVGDEPSKFKIALGHGLYINGGWR